MVSRKRSRLDSMEMKEVEPQVAHRTACLGRVAPPSGIGSDPIAEFGDAVDGRPGHEFDHPNQRGVRPRDYRESEGFSAAKLKPFQSHKLDRMAT